MFSKPFKPVVIKRSATDSQRTSQNTTTQNHENEPPAKRRRISEENEDPTAYAYSKQTKTTPSFRKPLIPVRNPPSPEGLKSNQSNEAPEGYYMVLWRKYTTKKNKTWDGDGVLALRSGYVTLQDISGRQLGQTAFKGSLEPGSSLSVSGRDVEVDCTISKQDFLAGKPFLDQKPAMTTTTTTLMKPAFAKFPDSHTTLTKPKLSIQAQMKAAMAKEKDESKKTLNVGRSTSKATNAAFRNPVKETTLMPQFSGEQPIPRHDPHAPGALVFKRAKTIPKGRQVVDVVLDPHIGKYLREHQREGIQFLYECVMGMRDFGGEGCILADDMGLGKTLQTIALLWTLFKQNPVHKADPVIRKAVIVCPVTLIDNWRKEFKKWLPYGSIGVFVADQTKKRLTDFTHGKTYSVMVIGYERLISVAEDLTKGAGIDIVIADEGHRLKTAKNKAAKAIQSLNTSKKIILSGTPIQNDLSEFFVMVNLVNDGCLETYKRFEKNFERPILKARQPNATEADIELGETRSEELAQITSPFILRRTADILSKYLPPKTEYVLFCKPTPDQANIYRHVVNSPMFQSAFGASGTEGGMGFQLITILKKLCNSPWLLLPRDGKSESTSPTSLTNLLEMLPAGLSRTFRNQASTKIRMLDQLLDQIRKTTDEKVVVVSNYTATLDVVATLLNSTGLPFLRLDGTTPSAKRQSLVDDFNQSQASSCFAFLLSAKAGGLGINLIGGSRLILFDVDWNPAIDDQAMARIHRQGQKRPCKIYRFVVKGAIEERIWQRQVVKRGLADSIMDGGSAVGAGGAGGGNGKNAFSPEELRDLFRLDESEGLKTHDLIGCTCSGHGTAFAEDCQDFEAREGDPAGPGGLDDSLDIESDSSEELPDVTTLTRASKLTSKDLDEQERRIRSGTHPQQAHAKKKPAQEMQALMEYVHLDTTRIPSMDEESDDLVRLEELVDDECLMAVLRQDAQSVAGGIAYLFKKSGGSKRALASEDGVGMGEMTVEQEVVKSSFFHMKRGMGN